jgi:hypothetical protein
LTAPAAPIGRFGNARVGSIEGPGLWQLDASLTKRISILERLTMNLFVLSTNTLNHPNLGDPNMNISSPTDAGRILSVRTDANASGVGPRQITLGLRMEF